ncbi:centromere protein Q [Dunckerocampus dactyliophorus]|uniref:centromere protein Q n=1 Tax=Dunckerocampus dactyliophorus TaxID=161453 RepID=UPI002406E3ED|nr:centromere protein Q [Dunckerocampus dactyliophorus]
MEPVRGSKRGAHKIPNLKSKTKSQKINPASEHPDSPLSDDNDKNTHQKSPRKRKVSRKVTGQEGNLKKIGRSSITTLESMMDLAILATLVLRRTEKEESQEHLNILKNRFLTHCAELQVPVKKQEALGHTSQRHQEERKKSAVGKQTLSSLEKDLKGVVSALESTEQQMSSLQNACSSLRERVEEEEENAKEILQRSHQSVLSLPFHAPRKDETTLEARLRKQVPDTECDSTARKLGEILQKSEAVKNAEALLTQAHKHLDQL